MVDLQARSRVFAALGDPRRALIVDLLAQGDRTAGQLAAALDHELPISLQGTLKHIAVLEQAGVVTRVKSGRTVTVQLRRDALGDAEAWLHRTRTFWTARLGSLAASFEKTEETR